MVIDFNQDWLFTKENGEKRIVCLPHDAMLTETRDAMCPGGKNTGYFPGGRYQYERRFFLKENDIGKSIELFFEGVYQNCSVYVNGTLSGSHKYGYTEFTVDISEVVTAGENHVSVDVDNRLQPNCRWYSGSGIYRPVSLIIRENPHPKTLRVITKSYEPAIIEVIADEQAWIALYDGNQLIAQGASGEYAIPGAKLWSAESPYLYCCVARVGNEAIKTTFGIRKLEWSSETGLLVNGREVLLRGGCIHHDNGVLGACSFADAEERRVRILKQAGYNAIRCAHNPASRSLLDACDRQGMYVMDEAFDGWYVPKNYHDYSRWFAQEWRRDVAAMVEKDINHPSVILYSIGNEVSETTSKKGVETCGEMAAYVRAMDDTRPVTCGVNVLLNVYDRMGLGVYKEKGDYKPEPLPPKRKGVRTRKTGSAFFNAMVQKLGPLMFFISSGQKGDLATVGAAEKLDIIGLNYASSRYDADAQKYPARMMVGAETMALDLPYNWARVKKHKALIGDFVWAAWDYIGEAGAGDWTYHSYPGLMMMAGSGTIDSTGKVGAEAYFQQVVWGLRKEPYLGVRPVNHSGEMPSKSAWRFTDAIDSWNWQGYEGKKAVVEVYSEAHAVRLELNGTVIGQKKLANFKALFKTRYLPGTLTAVALDQNGTGIAEFSLQTGSSETELRALPEKTVLPADGQSLCFLPIEFTDSDGNLKPCIEQPVELHIEGPVTLQGFGSSLAKTDEVFDQYKHNAHRGRALAVLRAGFQPGRAKITVTSAESAPVTIEIEVRQHASQ